MRTDNGSFPAYAWPGGYPIIYVADDGGVLCAACVNYEDSIHFDGDGDGWRIDAADVHWEGPDTYCDHCGTAIPSAYGDPDDETT